MGFSNKIRRIDSTGSPIRVVALIVALFQSCASVESKSVITTTTLKSATETTSDLTSNATHNETETVATTTTLVPPVKAVEDVEGNSTNTNSTNSNYIIEYKPVVFDSPEDIKTQQEWGGNCTLAHWDQCKVLAKYFGKYEDPKDGEIKEYLIDCKEEPVVCLKNSWTVTRCNLLCMSRCNREIQFRYDKYVSHSGECQAHAHG